MLLVNALQIADTLSADLHRLGEKISSTAEGLGLLQREPAEIAKVVRYQLDAIKAREAEIASEVMSEVEDSGAGVRPIYSNEAKRKAETTKRIAEDQAIKALQRTLDAAETKKLDADIKLRQAELMLRSLENVQGLLIANAELMAVTIKALTPATVQLLAPPTFPPVQLLAPPTT